MPPDVNLKDAIRFVTRPRMQSLQRLLPDPTDHLAALLAAPSISRAQPMSAQDYVSADDQLETGETLADDDIIALVTASKDSDDDEEDEPELQRVPSLAQAREAVSLLQVFIEARGRPWYGMQTYVRHRKDTR